MSTIVYQQRIDFLPTRPMMASEFCECLDLLGLNERQAAQRFGMSHRQIQNYKVGFRMTHNIKTMTPIPTPLALLLRLMINRDIYPHELK